MCCSPVKECEDHNELVMLIAEALGIALGRTSRSKQLDAHLAGVVRDCAPLRQRLARALHRVGHALSQRVWQRQRRHGGPHLLQRTSHPLPCSDPRPRAAPSCPAPTPPRGSAAARPAAPRRARAQTCRMAAQTLAAPRSQSRRRASRGAARPSDLPPTAPCRKLDDGSAHSLD